MSEETVKILGGARGFMGTGIIVCGLNGSGKSTLGKVLAEKTGYYFMDNEDLYFPEKDPDYAYAAPRTREEVERVLFNEVRAHENFVFASVKGNYGEDIYPYFRYAILIDVPKEIRMQRVKDRSFQKFGNRILPGGDLYEQENKFFQLVESREENMVEEWLKSLKCPVIRIDGTKPIEENVDHIIHKIKK